MRAKIREAEPVLDVEFPQLLQDMIGDLTSAPEPVVIKLFSRRPAKCWRQWAPRVGDAIKKIPGVVDVLDGIENTISGPAMMFKVDPVVTARAGFTPQEVEVDASAMLQGEPATAPVVCQRSLLHHSRALPTVHAPNTGYHPQHAAGERNRQRPPPSARWPR